MRRMLIGMSQEKLGNALGLTFQQVQKYEKGTNRISASRLQQISETLNIPLSFFFKGAPVSEGAANVVGLGVVALVQRRGFSAVGNHRRGLNTPLASIEYGWEGSMPGNDAGLPTALFSPLPPENHALFE